MPSDTLSHGDLMQHYRQQVRDHFIRLGRPEILGRIGEENIIVFDMLRPQHVHGILRKFWRTHRISTGENMVSRVTFDASVDQAASSFCGRAENVMPGGRGIRNFVVSHICPS